MNMTGSGLQCEVAYWPAMTLGVAAQVAATHCPNERTVDLQSAAITDPPIPQPAALWPSPRNVAGNDSLFSVTSIANCYSFTYPEGMEGWVGLSTMSVNNLLKVIIRQQSWWDSNPRPLSHWSEISPLRHRAMGTGAADSTAPTPASVAHAYVYKYLESVSWWVQPGRV